MTTEELKLILETIGQIADGGTTAAIAWMLLHYLAPLVQTVIIAGLTCAVAIYAVKSLISMNDWAEAGKRVARAYGHPAESYYYERHAQAIDKAIAKAKEQP